MNRKTLRENLKSIYVKRLLDFFKDDDVMQIASNKITMPVVDEEGNEDFIVIQVSIPTGANKGLDVFDGYIEAQAYQEKLKEKEEKKKESERKKQEKIKRDELARQRKAELREKRQ